MGLYRIKDYQNSLAGPRVGPLICGLRGAESFVSRLKWLYRNLSGGLYVNSENFLPVVGRVRWDGAGLRRAAQAVSLAWHGF